jgi:hypothetical protein
VAQFLVDHDHTDCIFQCSAKETPHRILRDAELYLKRIDNQGYVPHIKSRDKE